MGNQRTSPIGALRQRKQAGSSVLSRWLASCIILLVMVAVTGGGRAQTRDPLLDLMIQKGILTQEEASKVKAEADAIRTNSLNQAMPPPDSKWNISKAIKNVELFGDIRLRYEDRQATTPPGDRLELDRPRFALRLGLRGDASDNFYYGLRLETSSNPRSPWVTFGNSSPGPFGKSAAGINVGQAYIGWRPGDWVDITAGKMSNPLYTTSMVWDTDLNPEGLAERFKHSVGQADFFANLGQFVYQDNNPSYISGSLLSAPGSRQAGTTPTFLLAWQAGANYRFSESISAKIAGTLYQYVGLQTNVSFNGVGDTYIGEGGYAGPGSGTINGLNGPGATPPPFYYNQVGVNNLLVVDVPFEVNFKISKLNARVFGDFAYNLEGRQRATDAVSALSVQSQLVTPGFQPPLVGYGAQTDDVTAYLIGFAIGKKESVGLVYRSVSRKHAWEFRTYWQHVEQYALDPNLLDSDFFEGRGNMEGFYAALAYGFTDNMIATFRYGYASRINNKLGTGGSNLDIPQMNPIEHYNLLQLDLTLRF